MKQKYKVFINDQEIVFQHETISALPYEQELSQNLSPMELYHEVINDASNHNKKFIFHSKDPQSSFNKFISVFPVIEAAGGMVRINDGSGRILMIYRLGKWDLPKGKIDGSESPEQAAIREVEEECGIKKLYITESIGSSYHIYEHKEKPVVKLTHWFAMVTDDMQKPVPQTEEGISEVEWVDEKQMIELLPLSYLSIAELIKSVLL